MKINLLHIGLAVAGFLAAAGVVAGSIVSCAPMPLVPDEQLTTPAPIFPDYADVTIPPNIAPMNFALTDSYDRAAATFVTDAGEWSIEAHRGQFTIPAAKWRKMLEDAKGASITVRIVAQNGDKRQGYPPFELHVAPEPVDPGIVYRLIEPGYELWSTMGIYRRNLESYTQTPIMESKLVEGSCMNCHSFRMQNPDEMLFHLRGPIPATMIVRDGKVEKLNTKTPETMSPLVYPSWHPSGRFAVFSVNDTRQSFHMNDPNRVEVFDNASDVVVYDIERHEIIASPLTHGTDVFESFPTFSPDGRTLYFSSSPFVPDMMTNAFDVRYSLCAIAFDPDTRTFGTTVDTLYNARTGGRSASFPRISPDGRRLLYTLSDYGGFAIWHKEADLWIADLTTGLHTPLTEANSLDADSYHSWSSNSRWVVFSSRRIDGLYTRAHIAYIDAEGRSRKAFVVPQSDIDYYNELMYSHNVPEFVTGRVPDLRRRIARTARREAGIDVKFSGRP